jgi:hypothetical protein
MSINNKNLIWVAVFVIVSLICCTSQSKGVDIFNILLPTSYHATSGHARQMVTTSGDCYEW